MSSVSDFATSVTRIEDTPSPFREALLQRIQKNESIRHLIFSPAFAVAKFRALASLLCVTDRRWLIVFRKGDGSTSVDESSFDTTLLVELTIILLYGQLKIDFVLDGNVLATSLQFNTVMQPIYSEAIQDILDFIDGKEKASKHSDCNRNPTIRSWPLKFRNFSIIYLPKRSQLLDGVYWTEIRGGFNRELAPATAMLLTDRHIVIIAEEKLSSWFQFKRHAKYGAIITYFPLDRLAGFHIGPHKRFNILELEGYKGHGGEKLEIISPLDKQEPVYRLVEKASRMHPLRVAGEIDERK
jgi:hypothetical protein